MIPFSSLQCHARTQRWTPVWSTSSQDVQRYHYDVPYPARKLVPTNIHSSACMVCFPKLAAHSMYLLTALTVGSIIHYSYMLSGSGIIRFYRRNNMQEYLLLQLLLLGGFTISQVQGLHPTLRHISSIPS